MIEAEEQAFIQQLVTHAAVEAPDIAVLHWPSWRDVVPLDLVSLRPGEDGVRGELCAVVRENHSRFSSPFNKRRQFSCDTTT